MKKLIFLLLISSSLQAQEWNDSTITLQVTQRFAWWAAKAIELNWKNRKTPDALRIAVGSGTRPDSIFNVTIKAGLVRATIEQLLTRPLLLTYDDYRAIVLGRQPNNNLITGYTRLDTQITTKANNGDGAAIWLRDWYVERLANFTALYEQEKSEIIKRVN